MLALTVHEGDYVTIGEEIVVQVLKTGDMFRIAIDAPRSMPIECAKVHEQTGEVPECIRRVQRQNPPKYNTRKRPAAAFRDA